ncbi:DUF350 domain-containing protein [Pluralibacter gergoviae]|uniref:DUF350 domain-containing protein n=1 Tax=Pluralibacter gergoviae TaxID=61647 RepID=A0AAI9GJM9_PLUGE|nr:DUF350 domain-containing protein [Pluralibacter gergoviae]EKV0915709.1 DUF350 domain-containing protein [Pluralibacter gergoviae]EKV9907666.1 DUF350 domain-containing protein [Pluralibacter gergoviae]EKW7274267.1 DUF350 domain-containing protein [Pluralibacter gergoviae]ELD4294002.1 DUF350 domain-containing protein [Pluralibacter gergoviae]ELD4304781.1 DUF350 domain-containing protein [Pluralibacter gergoviae]
MHIMEALLAFCSYFFTGLAMVIVFLFIYTRITPHDEWQEIKADNTAASLALSGALLGYIIPLASAVINSVSLSDYLVWGAIALVVQLLVYGGVRIYIPGLSAKITGRNTSTGLFMGTAAVAGGLLNAACMTW